MREPASRTPDAAEWDDRYGASQQVWSGQPNGVLVAEAGGLAPGRALDVGCGEGADAVWLAGRGWQVTAVDVSHVALDRAERHAQDAGVVVTWLHAGLVEAGLPPGAFDLVSAQYPVLRRTACAVAERLLADLVAPGGTLLVVHHALAPHGGGDHHTDHGHEPGGRDGAGQHDHRHEGGFDPEQYVMPADVAAVLGDDWRVEVDERRPRTIQGGGGAHHAQDLVLRACRR